ncbi:MAG TPA: Clp protease N-terminal domain-containing protein [Streptosporangiaceae bacterium]|nr:Clp protease N-terminal domain-containing protein [Streptosporangiaceae bacterium]
MFERFTPDARAIVVHAQQHARRLGHNFIGGEHILLSVVSADHPASAVLAAHGITPEYVEAEMLRWMGPGRGAGSGDVPFGGLDREALASIGIDLDAVRARIEATFGPHAMTEADLVVQRRLKSRRGSSRAHRFRLDPRRALPPRLRRSRRRFHAGRAVIAAAPRPPRPAEAADRCQADGAPQDGHIPFTPVAKHILHLTLREMQALHDPNIGVQHIALALTAVRRGMVPCLLAAADAPAPALHAEILDRYRQAS